jgi:hypothetical protein
MLFPCLALRWKVASFSEITLESLSLVTAHSPKIGGLGFRLLCAPSSIFFVPWWHL